ncbi:MAG: hypothetical protein HYX72_03060 [Acidobacteria bacterium]|nr:hypothetical protein [Acidobacteriota bacterium]
MPRRILLNARDSRYADGFTLEDDVHLFVRDNGCGIPYDKLPNIFEPFFTTKEPGQGTALALLMARSIAEEHWGTIELINNAERGVTVRVCLPLCKGREQNTRCVTGVCPLTANRICRC